MSSDLGLGGFPLGTRSVVLPVGISFFTFMAISYIVDIYRRELEPASLAKFGAYLSFFPHLVAGPIVRGSELLPQLETPRDPRRVDTSRAFYLIATGLFKKVVIANYLATHIVDQVFGAPVQHSSLETWIAVYAYAVQIYADFSGYTDMAIGIALLLGFQFPQNFDSPYTAVSIQDFWRRWHMTLSRWLRDYLYIPLGGNRKGEPRTYLNLMVTMLLGGPLARRRVDVRDLGRPPRRLARDRPVSARARARDRRRLRLGAAGVSGSSPSTSSASPGSSSARARRTGSRPRGRSSAGCSTTGAPRRRSSPAASSSRSPSASAPSTCRRGSRRRSWPASPRPAWPSRSSSSPSS